MIGQVCTKIITYDNQCYVTINEIIKKKTEMLTRKKWGYRNKYNRQTGVC